MNPVNNFLIAFGLSADAFAAAFAKNSYDTSRLSHSIKQSILFGLAEMVMFIIGWLAANRFASFVNSYDHWIAFTLLGLIGCHMIHTGLVKKPGREAVSFSSARVTRPRARLQLLTIFATSIDAAAVGVSLAFFDFNLVYTAILIGLVSGLMSFFGMYLSSRMSSVLGKYAEIIGGLLLISIGTVILIEHIV